MDERPVLVVNEGELAGQRWTLNDSELIIGRGNDSDVVLLSLIHICPASSTRSC